MKTLFYLFIRILFIDFREKEEGRETHTHTHIDLLFHLFMHSWVDYFKIGGVQQLEAYINNIQMPSDCCEWVKGRCFKHL